MEIFSIRQEAAFSDVLRILISNYLGMIHTHTGVGYMRPILAQILALRQKPGKSPGKSPTWYPTADRRCGGRYDRTTHRYTAHGTPLGTHVKLVHYDSNYHTFKIEKHFVSRFHDFVFLFDFHRFVKYKYGKVAS